MRDNRNTPDNLTIPPTSSSTPRHAGSRPLSSRLARASIAFVATATLAALATTTTSQAATTSPTTINVEVTIGPSATALEAIAPAFTRETGIKVNFINVPYGDIPTKILLATKAHAGPYDVVQFDHPWQPEFAMAGALMPLDTLLKANPAYGMSDVPQAIQAYQQYNGTTYGLDLSTEPFVLYYRTDLFKQAGITQPPTTWAQYLQDANKLTTKTVYGAGSNYNAQYSAMTWGALGYESGGRVLAPNTNKPLLTTPVWERTTILYDQLLKDTPPATITNSQLVAQMTGFEAGTEAMTVETAGWWSDVANPATSKVSHDFSTAPLPTGNIGPYPSTDLLYGYEIGIPTYAPHKTAAGEFLMFELGKSEAKAFLAAGAAIPARVSTLSNPAYWKLGAPGSDFGPFLPVLMSVAKNCMAYPSLPTMPQIEATISENLSSMAAGQESPAAAMAKANSEVTQILRSAGELH